MRINEQIKVRKVAGENIAIMPGEGASSDLTRVVALNDSAMELYNKFLGKEFTIDDLAQSLTNDYDIDLATATNDAAKWVATMKENRLIVE